jgi:membrane peptidoglycan carboxypeptidase
MRAADHADHADHADQADHAPVPGKRRRPLRRLARRLLLGLCATVVLGPLGAFTAGYLLVEIPEADETVDNQVAVIAYRDGGELARLVPEEGNRIKVGLDRVPLVVRHAVLAAEDRSFFSNPGFDLVGIVRAAWNQLRGGSGGGSTITQQYVKNALVGNDHSLWRKYRELIVAVKLGRLRSKEEILTDYLNTIYFGRGAYGIESAAQAYFGVHVGELTAAQAAVLAGVIQSPSRWDPAVDPATARRRWDYVLDGMVAEGWLSPAERAAAQFPATRPRSTARPAARDARGHIVAAVRAELEELGFDDEDLAQGGLRITTTVDRGLQDDATAAARRALSRDELRAAVVSLDPRTGAVRAYFGGDDGVGLDYARVHKHAGSTFKPFVVLAGLLDDPPIGIDATFDGSEGTGRPGADGADCPRCTVTRAMTISNNAVFLTMAVRLGPDRVAAAARAAGIESPLDHPDERLALGNQDVTPLELTSAYATIAAGGVHHLPHVVARVVDGDGTVRYDAEEGGPPAERRFGERVARAVTETMLDVAPGNGLGIGRPVAGAPGSVPSHVAGAYNDAWFSGFTPWLATTVWIGTDRNTPIRTAAGTPITGGTVAGRAWRDVMAAAARREPPPRFGPYRPRGS